MIGKGTVKKLMAIAADTPIPTPNGWVLAADLKPADYLFKPKGGAQTIGSVQAYIPTECYRAVFDDGLEIVGDKRLAFALQDKVWRHHHHNWGKNRNLRYAKRLRRPLKIKTLGELAKEPLVDRRERKLWSLQTTAPIEYPHMDLPVPPYVFGLWLGSLQKSGRHFTTGKDYNHMQRMVRQYGFTLTKNNFHGKTEFHFRPGIKESFIYARTVVPTEIPQYYLEADVESRKMLLQGLIDANDARKKGNKYVITDSWSSIRRKQQLVESLGYKTNLTKRPAATRYDLFFHKNDALPGKTHRFLTQVSKIAPKQCIHITVDGEFVAGEGFLAVC